MLAVAEGNFFGFLNQYFLRNKRRPFVRTIAKGLTLRTTAGTPPIFSRLQLEDRRSF